TTLCSSSDVSDSRNLFPTRWKIPSCSKSPHTRLRVNTVLTDVAVKSTASACSNNRVAGNTGAFIGDALPTYANPHPSHNDRSVASENWHCTRKSTVNLGICELPQRPNHQENFPSLPFSPAGSPLSMDSSLKLLSLSEQ
ncbi:unnamed protein product, partial [Dicrocoelium dendriticum]